MYWIQILLVIRLFAKRSCFPCFFFVVKFFGGDKPMLGGIDMGETEKFKGKVPEPPKICSLSGTPYEIKDKGYVPTCKYEKERRMLDWGK